jgi:hypothetical protein
MEWWPIYRPISHLPPTVTLHSPAYFLLFPSSPSTALDILYFIHRNTAVIPRDNLRCKPLLWAEWSASETAGREADRDRLKSYLPTIYWTSFRGNTIGSACEVITKQGGSVGRRIRWNVRTRKEDEYTYVHARRTVSGWSGYFNAIISPLLESVIVKLAGRLLRGCISCKI